jgi:F0F1-type ATP synthase membrane subunit b/b'
MEFDIKAVETAIENANKAISSDAKNAKDMAEKAMNEAKDILSKMEETKSVSDELRKDFNEMAISLKLDEIPYKWIIKNASTDVKALL